MHTHKISISLPNQLFDFIENYQASHQLTTRSEVIKKALQLLQRTQLEVAYREAAAETNYDFDSTLDDGLENEAW